MKKLMKGTGKVVEVKQQQQQQQQLNSIVKQPIIERIKKSRVQSLILDSRTNIYIETDMFNI
ncbi:hypothetical protein DOY81_000607 [Sarcophaga bullata]|nr:hypothetical protein DOY81_000607 [Sarcophaga bullata]